jgi:hypothetical protein
MESEKAFVFLNYGHNEIPGIFYKKQSESWKQTFIIIWDDNTVLAFQSRRMQPVNRSPVNSLYTQILWALASQENEIELSSCPRLRPSFNARCVCALSARSCNYSSHALENKRGSAWNLTVQRGTAYRIINSEYQCEDFHLRTTKTRKSKGGSTMRQPESLPCAQNS